MQDLMNHIAALNAKTQAWIDAGPNRMAGFLPEDEAYWREQGITTVEEFKIDDYAQTFSDLYKDAYGFRPRFDTSDWTLERWEEEIDRAQRAVDLAIEEDRAREQEQIAEFERRIADLIETGAGDRETAIRWIVDAECDEFDLMYGGDFVCYKLGLPYSMQDVFTNAVNELSKQAA